MKHIEHCRLCLAKVKPAFHLAVTPIANNFSTTPNQMAVGYPLALRQCESCGHVQISIHIDGETLFRDYRYCTPEAERPRLAALAQSLLQKYPHAAVPALHNGEPQAFQVLEIGSNTGIFVEELNKAGFVAAGIDPSPNAPQTGMPKWFNTKSARDIRNSMGAMKLIVSNNTLAHVDDLRNVFVGVRTLLADDGVLVFEVQYLPDMIAGGMFDMIYHEHKDYHTLSPLPGFVAKFGMYVSEVEHIPTHGGSIRVHVRKGDKPSVEMPKEVIDWDAFSKRVDAERQRIWDLLAPYKRIAAFGATAKACTLIHQYALKERITHCIDDTPAKAGLYIPGTGIRITPEVGNPDAILLTAWNYADTLRHRFNVPIIVPFSEPVRRAA